MWTHPYALDLLSQWKKSPSPDIPKDLLTLLIYGNKIEILEIHEILYKYKTKKQKKETTLEILNISLETWFKLENGSYILKDLEDLSKETINLISKKTISHIKIDYIKNLYENINKLEIFNPEVAVKVTYKLIERIRDTDINIKKFIRNIESLIKTFNQKYVPKKNFSYKDNLADSSMLNFITKREKISVQNNSKFDAIFNEDIVYVYNLHNPNYRTLRRRRDLINPVKKIFIKFNDESRPPLYKVQPYQVFNRNSLKKLINVDYEEDSTWVDEDEGEDIFSGNSEKEEEVSGDEEWVDEDSSEQKIKMTLKRPMLVFPKIKCLRNEEENEFWGHLPLEKAGFINEDLEKYLAEYKGKEYCVQKLSNVFMIEENVIKRYLEEK